jgi:phosphoenolpyruvate carboxylase
MNPSDNSFLNIFNKEVGLKFQLYNSLFTALPFHKVEKTGVLVSIFLLHCEEGYEAGKSPVEIIFSFLEQYTSNTTEEKKLDLLFRFVQYSERQVVLFDALEDAAFAKVNDLGGSGTLKHLHSEIVQQQMQEAVKEKFKDFAVRLVLTAHPTQFYPSEVLVIISDLAKAIVDDNTALVNSYLQQLGKTPFFKSTKPTPYDEAVNLIWYLENVFYHAAGEIVSYLNERFPGSIEQGTRLIKLGFWPGGDRDGNPFVKSDTALKVSGALRSSIVRSYYEEVKLLKKRLTFKGLPHILAALEEKLYRNIFLPAGKFNLNTEEILNLLNEIRTLLIEKHNQLFLEQLDSLIGKVQLFGLHFASLDIRQDSSVHNALLEKVAERTELLPGNYPELSEDEKLALLTGIEQPIDRNVLDDEIQQDVIDTIAAVKVIQSTNGEAGCHRYIISHSKSALDVIGVYALFNMAGWSDRELTIDIVPLFESIDDLENAPHVMEQLYKLKVYRDHLSKRNNIQTIMLGFSDGTKDGGFLMANWSIYKAKEALTAVALKHGIEVVFFDGRGGPPARGGGRTHQFYSSMGSNIANKEIELTIQGQTISANFGTIDTARYNMEQLMHAGIWSDLFSSRKPTLTEEEDALLDALAKESYTAYSALKNQSNFLEYLNYASPLRYYSEANIGSRPSQRKKGKLNLNDLRAVPYVGSWSQMKQNLPGFYGVGTALSTLEKEGRWEEIRHMFRRSSFFRTILENCEMAMTKCFFPLTAYLAEHPEYGSLWNTIHDEYLLTKRCLLKLSGNTELMESKPVNSMSIQMRQRIELPLLTIQQYALNRIRELEEAGVSEEQKHVYEKLAMRCSFGIINAERNSA